jgi:hypothetical protein
MLIGVILHDLLYDIGAWSYVINQTLTIQHLKGRIYIENRCARGRWAQHLLDKDVNFEIGVLNHIGYNSLLKFKNKILFAL